MFKIIDADRHVTEPFSVWPEYVRADIYEKVPVYYVERTIERNGESIKYSQAMIGDYPVVKHWSLDIQWAATHLENNGKKERIASMSPETQLVAMDKTGVEISYLLPGFTFYIINQAKISSEVSIAYANAYNRWLVNYIAVAPDRLKPIGAISRHDPSTMVQQLKAIIERGWKSVVLRPDPINGRTVGDIGCHEFYQLCADNNIAIVFHGGTHLFGDTVGSDRYQSRFGLHACAHSMELQMAFLSLLESGVLENNPTLKIGLLEGGCSWVPHWLWRLDNICFPEFPSLVKENIRKLPSEYFRQHCWVNVEPGEPCVEDTIRMIGYEKLVFGSDFPHPDHLDLDIENDFRNNECLTREILRTIFEKSPLDLYENPMRLEKSE